MNLAQHILLLALRLYRWFVSPALTLLFGAACRFEPSCSVYAMDAVRRHGAVRGGWLAVKRLARCQPWGGCGCDPVPVLGFEFGVPSLQTSAVALCDARTKHGTRCTPQPPAVH
ncbi:MAG: membrane protein insertion efficiency factor YidD [Verrucomicrobia bacterium]|nr:membrane protein insertion efficiency factor YidD [Verrucomicrobiota bacterium]